MNRKFGFLLILSVVMLVFLAACSGDSSDEASSSSEEKEIDKSITRGITDDEIVIGNVVAHSGAQAIYGQIAQGAEAYFDYVNENGGVNGRKINFKTLDGEYQPAEAVQQSQRLVEEEDAFVMFANDCTPCNTATQDYFEEANVMSIMPSTGGDQFVTPPNDFYFGSSIANYPIETKVFYDFAVNELDAEKIAIVYQNDDYGKEGFEATKEVRDDYDAEVVVEVPVNANQDDFMSDAQKVKDADVDTIIMILTPNPAAKIKQGFDEINVKDQNFIVSSVGGNDLSLYDLAGEDVWEGTYSAGTIPMPDAPEAEGDDAMERYVDLYTEAYPDENYSGVPQWGYAAAEVLVEALERAGEDLNYETLEEALLTMDQWDEGTYAGVTFTPENHYGLTSLFMTRAQNGTIEAITDTIVFDPETGEIDYE